MPCDAPTAGLGETSTTRSEAGGCRVVFVYRACAGQGGRAGCIPFDGDVVAAVVWKAIEWARPGDVQVAAMRAKRYGLSKGVQKARAVASGHSRT